MIRDALLQCAAILYRDRRACQCSGKMSGLCINCKSRQEAENAAHAAIESLDAIPPAPAFPPDLDSPNFTPPEVEALRARGFVRVNRHAFPPEVLEAARSIADLGMDQWAASATVGRNAFAFVIDAMNVRIAAIEIVEAARKADRLARAILATAPATAPTRGKP